MNHEDIVHHINGILFKLSGRINCSADSIGCIVGGAAVDSVLRREPRDYDVVIFDPLCKHDLLEVLVALGLDWVEECPSYDRNQTRIEWCVKIQFYGVKVDFICWYNVRDIDSCMRKFDFDANQAWIDLAGNKRYTKSFLSAHAAKTATFNPKHAGISIDRMNRMHEKFQGYRFVGVCIG